MCGLTQRVRPSPTISTTDDFKGSKRCCRQSDEDADNSNNALYHILKHLQQNTDDRGPQRGKWRGRSVPLLKDT